MAQIVTGALRLHETGESQTPDADLSRLDEQDWRALLAFADRAHVTLAFGSNTRAFMPEPIRRRIDHNLIGAVKRFEVIKQAFRDAACVLADEGIETVVLKGFSQWKEEDDDVRVRPQYDIDLLCRPEDAASAQERLIARLGYEPVTAKGVFTADHLPLLIRKTGWQWKGDYFDPEQLPAMEIHFRLWDQESERIGIEGLERFWARRQARRRDGLAFTSLDPVDALAYAALHTLRHLLRGDLLLWHVYELAMQLDARRNENDFWSAWEDRYDGSFRLLQSVAFCLARRWFGCVLASQPAREAEDLPQPIQHWFSTFGRDPAGTRLLPPKSELWLHLSLLQSRGDMLRIARRKLSPKLARPALHGVHMPGSRRTVKQRIEYAVQNGEFLVKRSAYHITSLPRAGAQAIVWVAGSRGLDGKLARFIAASSLFNIGLSIFFLLYNLSLMKRGFHEDFLGALAAAMSTGTLAGTLPGGALASRYGLKRTLLAAFVATPLICAARTISNSPGWLLTWAFLGGFSFALYAVSLPPTVAQLVPESARPLAFSIVFSVGIGVTMLGSAAGGLLSSWTGGLQPVLLLGCAIASLGALAALSLRLQKPSAKPALAYPRGPVVVRFLAALALWSLATGAFNNFATVYFADALRTPVKMIGMIFAGSQGLQALAILCAPMLLRLLGLPLGIAVTQAGAAVALALLAGVPPLPLATVLFAAYMSCQYMSEPGLYAFLMQHSKKDERAGASALNFLVLLSGQAIGAAVSGVGIRWFGYSTVLVVAAVVAVAAALCFRKALGGAVLRQPTVSRSLPEPAD